MGNSNEISYNNSFYKIMDQNLRYFDGLLFIDANQNIYGELNYFSTLYDNQFLFFSDVGEAKRILDENPKQKYVIVCSSRLIEEISKTLAPCLNCFPKLIIFCGSLARCDQVRKQYGEIVYGAECYENKVVDQINSLQSSLIEMKKFVTLKAVWLVHNEADKKKIQNQFAFEIKQMNFGKGLENQYTTIEQLPNYLQYNKEIQKINLIIIGDNRDNKWQPKQPQLKQLRKKYANISCIFMICSQNAMPQQGADTCFDPVNSPMELVYYVESLIDWKIIK